MTAKQEAPKYFWGWGEYIPEEKILEEFAETAIMGRRAIEDRFGSTNANIILQEDKRIYKPESFPYWLRGVFVVGEEAETVTSDREGENINLLHFDITYPHEDNYLHDCYRNIIIDLDKPEVITGRRGETFPTIFLTADDDSIGISEGPASVQLSDNLTKLGQQKLNIHRALIIIFSPRVDAFLWMRHQMGHYHNISFPTGFVYIDRAEEAFGIV